MEYLSIEVETIQTNSRAEMYKNKIKNSLEVLTIKLEMAGESVSELEDSRKRLKNKQSLWICTKILKCIIYVQLKSKKERRK